MSTRHVYAYKVFLSLVNHERDYEALLKGICDGRIHVLEG
jgi:hypothetical protein